MIQGIKRVPSGPRYPEGTYLFNVSKGYIMVHGIKSVSKGYQWSKVSTEYLVVHGIQRVPTGQRYPKGT